MCKIFHTFYGCGCATTFLVVERCIKLLHDPEPTMTCETMVLEPSMKRAIAISDNCDEHPYLPTGEAERRARIPTEHIRGRWVTANELNAMPKLGCTVETTGEKVVAAIIGLDAFQSLSAELLSALPEGSDKVNEERGWETLKPITTTLTMR
ncbi:hypothetical protein BAUCODRAFT_135954 [Baudoinia panamericana UAMH 10762]|uniref:Uncharacterized protein n=1 Tax=Baudoinia panamericana (strain UAMH 10762) TaxID=717646 RepID=M2MW69_BAUPA|nr:uncharacterized protein BAUCODRAFT_135954 [Baudoinia panamericana UAMH 10762]EMD01232.1 hypothetical protein BAUCODRAFT_135954 [Baudoinia panamericana UAMH 10762]